MGMLLPISNYNGIISAMFCIPIFIFLYKKGMFLLFTFVSTVFFFLISTNRLYSLIDSFTIIIVMGMIILFGENALSKKELKFTQLSLLVFFCINLFMVLIPSKYHDFDGEIRFMGLFNACNLSVSIMTICGVAIWEIEKRIKCSPRKKILILNLIGFFILVIATRTRTVLFLLPYWMYQCYESFNRIFFIGGIIIGLGLFGSSIIQSLNERMNLEGDASSATRAAIYLALIDGILDNNVIIPHGSNEAFLFIKEFTDNPDFSSHNDYLRYIYDWGLYFFVFLYYIVYTMKKFLKFNLEFNLILIGYAALALHNMLFLPIAWIPFCIILNMRKMEGYNMLPLSEKIRNGVV